MTQDSLATPNFDDPDAVSPDELMGDFRGRPIVKIVVFTLIIHVVVVGVFSVGYLKDQLLGVDTSQLGDEERMDIAVREATTALREITDRHNVSIQDLSSRFAGGARKAIAPPASDDTPDTADPSATTTPPDKPDEPGSEIEKTLQTTEDGPDVPSLAPNEEDDDLFAPDAP